MFSTIALDSLVLENLSTQVSVAQRTQRRVCGFYHRLDATPVASEREEMNLMMIQLSHMKSIETK